MNRTTLIISPAPTANGDVHLGHIAGPFLAADVYARYLRASGRSALLATGAQDTSTYVVTTARRLGILPKDLIARSTRQVEASLAAIGIEVDAFTRDEDRFTETVLTFMEDLYAAGKLELRTMQFPYSPATDQFLVDGFAQGSCPRCLTRGSAGLCESCGNMVAAGDLLDPCSALDPSDPVELRQSRVLVLPLEQFRHRISDHFAEHAKSMRPHMAQSVREMLSRPLPDYPVTFPIAWGIPAPFPEVSGQSINPNAEPAAWSIYCGQLAAERRGMARMPTDDLWASGAHTRVAYFLGFDNTYPFAIAAIGMLLATEGRYLLPTDFVTNEFYELDHAKFSTSRGHAVWVADLVSQLPRDLVRFHLAVTSPENQRTNFSHDALVQVTTSRLVDPWNRIAQRMDQYVGSGPLPVSPRSRMASERIVAQFAACYELEYFSLTRAAEALTEQFARLANWDVDHGDVGDFCHEVDVVLRCASPILVDLAEEVLDEPHIPVGAGPATVTPVTLPRLQHRIG